MITRPKRTVSQSSIQQLITETQAIQDQATNTYALQFFGDGADGNVTISSGTTVLARDMYYDNLTINGTGALDCAGYRVFVKTLLDLTAAPAGAIMRPTLNGGNASGATGGAHGGVLASGTIPGSGAAQSGQSGGLGVGQPSVNYGPAQHTLGGRTGRPGRSGAGGATAGSVAQTFTAFDHRHKHLGLYLDLSINGPIIQTLENILGFIGASGGGATPFSGGGGGAIGSPAALLAIFAREISRGVSTASGAIRTKGGAGGNGAQGTGTGTGGGSGGPGGGGGYLMLVFESLSGALANDAIDVSGGNAGTSANGQGTGSGANGSDGGGGGVVVMFDLGAGTITESRGPAGTTGGAASGTTAGAAGIGGAFLVDL
jgi:hypothetical protein